MSLFFNRFQFRVASIELPTVTRSFLRVSVLSTLFLSYGSASRAQQDLTVVLVGQSMIRSDLRATAPDILAAIRPLLSGDVVFTNLEAAIALPGQTAQEGRGFLAPAESLDTLQRLGFNLLALAGNHAFDLGRTGDREHASRNHAQGTRSRWYRDHGE